MADKMRVHILAKELNVSSKAILEKCAAEDIEGVTNHMSTLSAGLEATIREWFSEGSHSTVIETSQRVDLAKVRTRRRTIPKAEHAGAEHAEAEALGAQVVTETMETVAPSSVEAEPAETHRAVAEVSMALVAEAQAPAVVVEGSPQPAEEILVAPVPVLTGEAVVPAEAEAEAGAAEAEARQPAEVDGGIVEAPVSVPAEAEPPRAPVEPIGPAGPQNVPLPPKLTGPRVVRYEPPDESVVPRRGVRRRPEPVAGEGVVPRPVAPAAPGAKGDRTGHHRDDDRTDRRSSTRRSARSASEAGEKLLEWRDQDLAERAARLRGATGRRLASRRAADRKGARAAAGPAGPVTSARLVEPITAKNLCAAIGVPFQKLFPVMSKEHGLTLTLPSIVPKQVAELVAAHFGIELVVEEAKTGLDQLKEEYQAIERKNLQLRPPIVTVLGHVDHGKTSLLDYIRRSRVAAREDGGITQHISSYHFRSGEVGVTFLDTPGHEAFTALRARGAQITDIVVLVVAADDGIMPQTTEAINHAKAAGVPIVVALNKIDLGTQNVQKIYGQLSERGLTPSGDWGGHTDVIHTSATRGDGVEELLAHLSALADVYEWKADPTVPAMGTVIEAESRAGAGPVLQVIVRDGTLQVGDVLVCGNAYGKVRALHDDKGKPIHSAGPSMPAEVWGMNEVPAAGDHFYRVENMQRAKVIADEVRQRRVSESRVVVTKARGLDDLVKQRSGAEIPALNVIIRADVDGSADVLAQTLAKFPAEQVKLSVLHAGVGAVTDSDVHLASASDAIIIAFRVTTPTGTRKLAEQEGVDIRQYKVIYEVTDDIRKAMEGLLAPEEVVETRGTVEVREVFRISRVGLVAGCYVRDGVVANNHRVRIIRDGVLIRDRCAIESLKRFKDDVKEARSGMECGIHLVDFTDLKIGDILESFEVTQVARKLD